MTLWPLVTPDTNRDKKPQKLTFLTDVTYNFGLKFFPPPAVTMGCYNVHAKTYFNQSTRSRARRSHMYWLLKKYVEKWDLGYWETIAINCRILFTYPPSQSTRNFLLFSTSSFQRRRRGDERKKVPATYWFSHRDESLFMPWILPVLRQFHSWVSWFRIFVTFDIDQWQRLMTQVDELQYPYIQVIRYII